MEREPLSVLLVDDEGFFISLIASQLHDEYGYRTETAFSGQEAVRKISLARYDVIVLDYQMPEMSGLNVLQWMLEQKNETPVVMLTGAGSEAVAVEAMKLGAYDYIRKELVDVQRIAIVVQATHERRQFRIAKEMELDKEREIKLNLQATEDARRLLNTIAPRLNEEFASAGVELEVRSKPIRQHLPEELVPEFDRMLGVLKTHFAAIETGVRGLLGLFKVMYARHSEATEIQHLKGEFEARVAELHKSESGGGSVV
ncbi:MAG: response regulator [Ignavibacteriales bacterium]|nr:response regulator [Ignavibacteriales bacterium]